MPAKKFSDIRGAIETILTGITGIGEVNAWHKANPESFPAVSFDVSEEDGEFLTTKENLRRVEFTIMVQTELQQEGQEESIRILDDITDKILDAIENDFQLGLTVDWALPVSGPRNEITTPSGTAMTQTLFVRCQYRFLTS